MPGPASAIDLIRRKRDGGALTADEIGWLIAAYMRPRSAIPAEQMAAFLMAVFWRGMSEDETVALTLAMARSGKQLQLRDRFGLVADKHSTGGVGDKMTLIVAPIVAACGLPVAKMAGRGLGHTGGTIDKLESIPGLRTEFSASEFIALVERHGLAIAAQSSDLAPADGKLYALRDVTGTVESIPLIAASIMSKKLAIGPSDLLLDVKVGRGAFMKTEADACTLARLMVRIGRAAGIRTTATLTAMDQPLGVAVGNLLEVGEVVSLLDWNGTYRRSPNYWTSEVVRLALHESALLLRSAGLVETQGQGEERAREAMQSGAALAKLDEMIVAQGGDPAIARDKMASVLIPAGALSAPRDGWIAGCLADVVGEVAVALGAGRARKGASIAPDVGLRLYAKIGEHLGEGQLMAAVYAHNDTGLQMARERLLDAITWSDAPVAEPPLMLGEVE